MTSVAALAVAIVALLAMITPAASAATHPTTPGRTSVAGNSTAKANTPAVDEYCNYLSVTPFQNVQGGTTYGRGLVVNCSVPPPAECHLIVNLQVYQPDMGGWQDLSTSDPGWTTNCSVQATASYNCQASIKRYNFRSEVSLAVLGTSGGIGTSVTDSPVASLWCAGLG